MDKKNGDDNLVESDLSIIAGLGLCRLSSEFDQSLHTLNNKEPAAASTAYTFKSRDKVIEKLLEQRQQEDFKKFRIPISDQLLTINIDGLVNSISPPKTFEERLLSAKNGLTRTTFIANDSKRNGSSSSCIDINDMSCLSTNSFLVDVLEKRKANLDEQCVLNTQNLENGLPSVLIAGTKKSLNDNENVPFSIDPWDCVTQIQEIDKVKTSILEREDDDNILGKEIEFNMDQFSAQSTFFQKSNLLSSSCNSLGSFGKDDDVNNSLPTVSQFGQSFIDSFIGNQQDLADFAEGEKFLAINASDFDKEEKVFEEDNIFNINETFSGEHGNKPDLSGIYASTQDITIRASWLSGLKCDLKPGDKINIDQLFKAKSCNLGSLDDKYAEKPSFGFSTTESPPKEIPESASLCFQQQLNQDEEYLEENNSLKITSLNNVQTSSVNFIKRSDGDGRDKSIVQKSYLESNPPNLVKTLKDLQNSISSESLKKLLLEASKTDNAAKMIDEVLKLVNSESVNNVADESSIVDTSYEVLELRKLKEDRFKDFYGSTKDGHNKVHNENKDCSIEIRLNDTLVLNKDNGYASETVRDFNEVNNIHRIFNKPENNSILVSNNVPDKSAVLHESQMQNIMNNHLNCNAKNSGSSPKRQAKFIMGTSSLRNKPKSDSAEISPVSTSKQVKSDDIFYQPINSNSQHFLSNSQSTVNVANEFSDFPGNNNQQQSTQGLDQFRIPSEVSFTDPCLTSMKSETAIQISNDTNKILKISATELKETVNSKKIHQNFLFMKNCMYVQARSSCKFTFELCASLSGLYKAELRFAISELNGNLLYEKWISIYANILHTEIDLLCEGLNAIDFGIVPEGCLVQKELAIINQSNQAYPVMLSLKHELETTTEVLYWGKSKELKLVTPSLAACELQTSKEPIWATVMFKAPSLDNFTGHNECLIVSVISRLFVTIDSPVGQSVILKEIPIKAQVGEVRIRTVKNEGEVILIASSRKIVSKDFYLQNESSFPLKIKANISETSKQFSVSPSNAVMEPHTKFKLRVSFDPTKIGGKIDIYGLLKVCVEPDGMEFEVPIRGVVNITQCMNTNSKVVNLKNDMVTDFAAPSMPTNIKLNRDLSFDCSRSRIVFGTVDIKSLESQNLILYNNWPDQELILIAAFVGSCRQTFTMSFGTNQRSKSIEVKIPPNGEANLNIYFEPSSVHSYSTSLVCKPRGLLKQVKITLPIQGFGGSGNLIFCNCEKGETISFGEIAPGNPSTSQTSVKNIGSRAIFVKLIALYDENSEEQIPISDLKIYPSDFILKPQESREILLVATGTPVMVAKAPGIVGVLEAVYGDEILRQRFRSLKSRKVRNKKIKDFSVLKINWDTTFVNENEVNEKNDLPLQPDDVILFLNGCTKKKIFLAAEIDPDSEVSSTISSIVQQEETLNSFIQTQLDDNSFTHSILPEANKPHCVQDFDAFPKALRLNLSSLQQSVTVVNYSHKDQVIEAVCKEEWLTIEPVETMLLHSKFSILCFKLQTSKFPSPLPRLLKTSVEILGENCLSIVQVTLDVSDINSTSRSLPQKIQNNSRAASKLSEKNAPNLAPMCDSKSAFVQERDASCCVTKESRVELPVSLLTFHTIKAKTCDALKLSVKNLDNIPHQITASVKDEHFFIRHESFTIKPGFNMNLPVYFSPQRPGNFIARLKLTVAEDGKQLQAKLMGSAV